MNNTGNIPNFLGIGAAKSGTSTVAKLISQHPQISFPISGKKEMHFFDEQEITKDSIQSYFNDFDDNFRRGEFTPSYLFDKKCRDRIFDVLGKDVKFIIVLRNPIDRAYSHYCHAVNNWHEEKYRVKNYPIENLTFEEAIEKEEERLASVKYHIRHLSYYSKGLYAKQLKYYFEKFDIKNFIVILNEDLATNPTKMLKRICKFLEVDTDFYFESVNMKLNTQTKGLIPQKTRLKLIERYYDSICELENLIQRDLSSWKIC